MLENIIKLNFFKILKKIEYGQILVTLPDKKKLEFKGSYQGRNVDAEIIDWRVIINFLLKGDIGLASDYRDGYFKTTDLLSLFYFIMDNQKFFLSHGRGKFIFRKLYYIFYLTKRNTIKGSQKNIRHHYDLGNDFYKLWLDDTMTYSSGVFLSKNDSLQTAQINKYQRILDKIGDSKSNILEIGCGWGGFAKHATNRNHSVRGITLSLEQAQYAKTILNSMSSEIIIADYRNQSGLYDHIVSIEMFEAVGKKYWPIYFKKIKELLRPTGKFIMQTITIDEALFKHYSKSSDMIRTFIFPGGLLPTENIIKSNLKKNNLICRDIFKFGQDYAMTIEIWLDNFKKQLSKIKSMGFGDDFIKIWEFYLAECIVAFKSGRINVVQMEITHENR
jgi:cyclopropane-fatty-acyl-phospholipid synthase